AVLLGATIFSATLAGVDVDPLALAAHPALLLRGLPFAATLVFILLVHESGHYVACLRHRVSASLPYFIPAPLVSPVGTFGAFLAWLGVRGWPGWLLWTVSISVRWSLGQPPTDYDRRALGRGRRLAALATFVIFVLTFVPEPIKLLP